MNIMDKAMASVDMQLPEQPATLSVSTDKNRPSNDKLTKESIRASQRKFALVYQAFINQWPTQSERIKYANQACGHEWIGSHACATTGENSCVIAWQSDKPTPFHMGPCFWIALARWNKRAHKDGLIPIRFTNSNKPQHSHQIIKERPLPQISDFMCAFHGIGEPLSFSITSAID
jgi:hypothetical protein